MAEVGSEDGPAYMSRSVDLLLAFGRQQPLQSVGLLVVEYGLALDGAGFTIHLTGQQETSTASSIDCNTKHSLPLLHTLGIWKASEASAETKDIRWTESVATTNLLYVRARTITCANYRCQTTNI